MSANPCGLEKGERRRRLWADAGFVVVLLLLVWAAYGPALHQTVREDQWCYLVDTIDRRDFLDVFAHSYSYNRTRTVMPGDTDLFRPLLFMVLAGEKAWIPTNFAAQQAIGIVLHCGVCLLLLVVLRQTAALRSGVNGSPARPWARRAAEFFPYGVVLFFALSFSIQELVTFAHLHGYLVFFLLVLGSLSLLLRHMAAGGGRLTLTAAWALALLSAFTYELGQAYAVLAGVVMGLWSLPRLGRRRAAALTAAFCSILVLYQAANEADRLIHRGSFAEEHNRERVVRRMFSSATVTHGGRFVVYTVFQPFFPAYTPHTPKGGRLNIPEWVWNGDAAGLWTPAAAASWAAVGLAAALAAAGAWRMLRGGQRNQLAASALFLGLYAGYAALNVLGRMNLRPVPYYISTNSYYVYGALLFALLAGHATWAAYGPGRAAAFGRGALLLLLAGLGIVGAVGVRQVNRERAAWAAPLRHATHALNKFVARHGGEPDFSMAVDYAASDEQESCSGIPLMTILFKRWMSERDPKYVVALRWGEAVILRTRVSPTAPAASAGPAPPAPPEATASGAR
jgi:hypothetical protein